MSSHSGAKIALSLAASSAVGVADGFMRIYLTYFC